MSNPQIKATPDLQVQQILNFSFTIPGLDPELMELNQAGLSALEITAHDTFEQVVQKLSDQTIQILSKIGYTLDENHSLLIQSLTERISRFMIETEILTLQEISSRLEKLEHVSRDMNCLNTYEMFIGSRGFCVDVTLNPDHIRYLLNAVIKDKDGALSHEKLMRFHDIVDGIIPEKDMEDTALDMIATLYKVIRHSEGAKTRKRFSEKQRAEVFNLLSEGFNIESVPMTAGQFVLPLRRISEFMGIRVLPYHDKPIPNSVFEKGILNPKAQVLDGDGNLVNLETFATPDSECTSCPYHFTFSTERRSFTTPGYFTARPETTDPSEWDTQEQFLEPSRQNIILSGVTSPRPFTLSKVALKKIAQQISKYILTNLQYSDSHDSLMKIINQFKNFKTSSNYIAYEYATMKKEGLALEAFASYKSFCHSISFNAAEAYEALSIIKDNPKEAKRLLKLNDQDISQIQSLVNFTSPDLNSNDKPFWEKNFEDPEWIIQAAVVLQNALQLPLVRVRGLHTDVCVTDKKNSLQLTGEVILEAAFAGRFIAQIKAARRNGINEELQFNQLILPFPSPEVIAATYKAFHVMNQLDNNSQSNNESPGNFYRTMQDGRLIVCTSPPTFFTVHDTTTCGDIMCAIFNTKIGDFVTAMHKNLDLHRYLGQAIRQFVTDLEYFFVPANTLSEIKLFSHK
jgi:hypothetical protein